MRAMKKVAATMAHVTVFSLTIHVWHIVTSDRMIDAYADVGVDKAASVVLRSVGGAQ